MHPKYPHVFSPIKVGPFTLKNRIEAAPMNTSNPTLEGYLTPENIAVFEARARGGAAMVNIGECRVDAKTGMSHKFCIPLDDPEILPYLHATTDAIKKYNCFAVAELIHPGSRSNPIYYDGPIWAPSDGPGHLGKDYVEMTQEIIDYVVECFGDAAEMAKLGGIDMVMLHGGHGWLIHQFLSPLNNRRTDKYGGCLENRARFLLEVIASIRKKCGPDFPIELRMSGSELVEGGLTLEDQIELVKLLDGKVDLFHITSGTFHVPSTNLHMIPSCFLPPASNAYLAEAIKKVVKHTPVVTVGGLGSPEMMEKVLAEGKADMIAINRPLLADPDLPNKMKEGREDEIYPCLRCMACISESFVPYVKFPSRIRRCPVNPIAYKEIPASTVKPTEKPKKVLVAGGGPAGMEAATVLAQRGHEVVLCEKEDHLGGKLVYARHYDFKGAHGQFLHTLIWHLEHSGAQVRLNTEVTPALVEELRPDVIVAAMGSQPVQPDFRVEPGAQVIMALDCFDKLDATGQNVVIVGGGQTGCEISVLLGRMGKQVTVVDRKPELARDGAYLYRDGLFTEMDKNGVKRVGSTTCLSVRPGSVTLRTADGTEQTIPADTVIAATGMRALEDEAEQLRPLAFDFWRIGDCFQVRKIFNAMREGYNAGAHI